MQPDRMLGAALRAALEPPMPAAFVARVLAAAEAARTPAWTWLAHWARSGIAAAVLLALAATVLGRLAAAPVSLDEAFFAAVDSPSATSVFFMADHPPDPGSVFADLMRE